MSRFKLNLALCLATVAMGMSAVAVRAEEAPKEEAPQQSESTKTALNLAAAYRMAAFGREAKAPEALLAAARVIGKTSVSKLGAGEKAPEGATVADPLKEATELIDEAIKLSNGDEAVKKLAKAVQDDIKEGKRGASRGPRVITGTLSGTDRRDTYSISFRGGEEAVIIVNNRTNRGDIDLFVQDDNGRIVARDRRRDDDASVRFFVRRPQHYQVFLRNFNPSVRTLRYTLTTN